MKGSLSGRVGYSLHSSKNKPLLVGLFVQNKGQCRSIDLSNKVTEGLAYTTKRLSNEQWGREQPQGLHNPFCDEEYYHLSEYEFRALHVIKKKMQV